MASQLYIMKPEDIGNIRLTSQQIADTQFKTAKEIVRWMGAMQAQDYNMAKWALGVRLTGSTADIIQAAIDQGEILRTHVLRPTWHFVSADDIYWMLELSAPRIKAFAKGRYRELELTAPILLKSYSILETALSGGKHLIREELVSEFNKAKIRTDDNRAAHLLMNAELEGLICSGTANGKKQTYALLEERVPKPKSLNREEALAKLTIRYFMSHCPATLEDFAWWAGLTITDARRGMELVRSNFISEIFGSEIYWLTNSFQGFSAKTSSVFLLPAFDEFTISYKNRSASLLLADHKKAISSNGLFRPLIVVNGKVTGLWKPVISKDKVVIETDFFKPHNKTLKLKLEKAAEKYGNFLGKKAVFN